MISFRRERGAAVLELALVTPVLALISLGVLDLTRCYHSQIRLENAAREGGAFAQIWPGRVDCGDDDDITDRIVGEDDGLGDLAGFDVRVLREDPYGEITVPVTGCSELSLESGTRLRVEVVLGSSVGYIAVRNAQNAVDAASLGATAALRDVKQGTRSAADVRSTAVSIAEDNGAAMGSVHCDVVVAEYALTKDEADVLGPCTDANIAASAASGIRVTADDTRMVPFNAFVGQDEITASARATATVQPVRTVKAPFMVCSASSATGHPALPVIANADDPTGYSINADAIGKSFVVHGKDITLDGRDCGNGSANWRGFIPPDQDVLIPPASQTDDSDWLRIDDGNADGTLDTHLSGAYACGGDVSSFQEGCRISLPLCPKGNAQTGTNFRLYCVKMGVFVITYSKPSGSTGSAPCHISPQGNSTICATFVGAGTATEGIGSATTFDPNEVVVVKLVE